MSSNWSWTILNLWKLLKQTAPGKPGSKAHTVNLVDDEHVTDPVKIADAFNDYFTSMNATSAPPEGLSIAQTELDVLLQDFVNSHSPPSSEGQFSIPPVTKEFIEADLSKIPTDKATDGISIRVIKEALPAISTSLAHIYNAASVATSLKYYHSTRKIQHTWEVITALYLSYPYSTNPWKDM